MSTAELNEIKLNLNGWIDQLSDTDLISFLEGIRKSKSAGNWWSELNPEQKKMFYQSLRMLKMRSYSLHRTSGKN